MADRLELNDKGSFLDDENQMVIDAVITEISEHLFEQWNSSNLDEGTFYADYQIALMTDDKYIKSKFNEFYGLTLEDEEYFNVGL